MDSRGYNKIQHAAHHSHPHPPPRGSLDDSHIVMLLEYTLFQLTANRKTDYPAKAKKSINREVGFDCFHPLTDLYV